MCRSTRPPATSRSQSRGFPIRGGLEADAATATLRLDEAQLRDLMSTVDGFPADSLGLADPNVTIATELKLLGVGFPVGVALTPSAAEGDIVLTPAGLQLAGAEISAADLKDRFGRIADAVLRPWTVCIAQYIPAGVVLDSVAVDGRPPGRRSRHRRRDHRRPRPAGERHVRVSLTAPAGPGAGGRAPAAAYAVP